MYIPASMTLDQSVALAGMIDIRKEKMSGWRVELIRHPLSIIRLKEDTIIGSFTYTQMGSKRKRIFQSEAVNIGAGWCTPMDIARDYLNYRYANRRPRIMTDQYNLFVLNRQSPPLYAAPQSIDEGVYLDIKSAYWQIVKRVGWDVDYMRGKYMSKRSDNSDFPVPELKLARNSLVSLGLVSQVKMWDASARTLRFIRMGNKFVNHILWGLVMDVLNSVAYEMVSIGAIYAHTDGYILPYRTLPTAFEIAETWGLELRVKHEGPATVYGTGRYDIGGRRAGSQRGSILPISKVYHAGTFTRDKFKGWQPYETV